MLVLIVGITGNIGSKLADALIRRGHQVRGLSRSRSKLPTSLLDELESFHENSSWYDVATIRKAVRGVDTVVCTYMPVPTLVLDAQLLLVRIMEEEGVTRFIPSAWNLDWTQLHWGGAPYYDLFLALRQQLELSSSVKAIYIFVGILAEVFYSVPGHGGFAPANHGVWDPNPTPRRAVVWGTGDEKWQTTTEQDCAEFTAELVADTTKNSGCFRFISGEYSTKELAKIYEEVRGVPVELEFAGSIEDLKVTADKAKGTEGLQKFWDWMGYYYQYYQLNGTFYMKELDMDLYPSVKPTSLVDFLKQNPHV